MGVERVAEASSRYHAPNMIAEELFDPSKKSLIAETETGIVGYAMSEADPTGAVILDRLHIDPSQFGTGLAANLLEAICASYPGLAAISLEVVDCNDRAVAFYRKQGFQVIDHRPASHGAADYLSFIMEKRL
jgi:ribosomal protein S18 acetylase RimI-like enzyme